MQITCFWYLCLPHLCYRSLQLYCLHLVPCVHFGRSKSTPGTQRCDHSVCGLINKKKTVSSKSEKITEKLNDVKKKLEFLGPLHLRTPKIWTDLTFKVSAWCRQGWFNPMLARKKSRARSVTDSALSRAHELLAPSSNSFYAGQRYKLHTLWSSDARFSIFSIFSWRDWISINLNPVRRRDPSYFHGKKSTLLQTCYSFDFMKGNNSLWNKKKR